MKLFKLLLIAAFGLNSWAQQIPDTTKQQVSLGNIISNAGFENGKQGYTNSGGTFSIVKKSVAPANVIAGKQSASFQASAAGQYFESSAYSLERLEGNNCLASLRYIGGDSNLYLSVFDSGNTEIIPTTSRAVLNNSSGKKQAKIYLVCPSTGSVKLRVVSTAASAIGYFDDMLVDDTDSKAVTEMSDWREFTVTAGTSATIRSTGTAPSFGNIDTNKAYYRIVGSNLEIKWDYRHTSTGGSGTGAYLFNISQLGFTIDVNKVKATTGVGGQLDFGSGKVGDFEGFNNDTPYRVYGGVHVYDSQNLKVGYLLANNSTGAAGFSIWGAGGMPFGATNTSINMRVSVPITGQAVSATVINSKCPTDKDCENQFTAKGSSTGVVTDDTLDFINGNCTNANPSVCTFNSGFFTVAPSCPGSSAVTSTTVSYPNTTGFTVSCFKAPADYKAKQVIQGQISNTVYSDTGLKFEKAAVAGATESAVCSTTPCTLYRTPTSGITSVTRSGTGTYTINFNRILSNPMCVATGTNGTAPVSLVSNSYTGTSVSFTMANASGASDSKFEIICVGF